MINLTGMKNTITLLLVAAAILGGVMMYCGAGHYQGDHGMVNSHHHSSGEACCLDQQIDTTNIECCQSDFSLLLPQNRKIEDSSLNFKWIWFPILFVFLSTIHLRRSLPYLKRQTELHPTPPQTLVLHKTLLLN